MPVRQTAIGVFFVVSSHMFMLPERIPNGQLKAQDHQRQLTSLPRWYGLQAAVVGGSIPVANIYERHMMPLQRAERRAARRAGAPVFFPDFCGFGRGFFFF